MYRRVPDGKKEGGAVFVTRDVEEFLSKDADVIFKYCHMDCEECRGGRDG